MGIPPGRDPPLCSLLQVVYYWVELAGSTASQEGVQKESAKGCSRGRFQAGSVSQREGGNELSLVGGFHPNGNPNMGL